MFLVGKNTSTKYLWNEDLKTLKEAPINKNKIWTAAGKLRQGPIFGRPFAKRFARFRVIMRQDIYTVLVSEMLFLQEPGPELGLCGLKRGRSVLGR